MSEGQVISFSVIYLCRENTSDWCDGGYWSAAEEHVSVSRGERTWTGNAMVSGRYLTPIVSTNSKFPTDRRYPLPNRSRGARYFLRDPTFLLCILCLQHNPTLANGSTPARASSGHVSTSFIAF